MVYRVYAEFLENNENILGCLKALDDPGINSFNLLAIGKAKKALAVQ